MSCKLLALVTNVWDIQKIENMLNYTVRTQSKTWKTQGWSGWLPGRRHLQFSQGCLHPTLPSKVTPTRASGREVSGSSSWDVARGVWWVPHVSP